MFLTAFMLAYVGLSLIGIGSGLTVMYSLFSWKRADKAIAVFFLTTIATGEVGFGVPFTAFTRIQAVGILFLYLLAFAIDGWYEDGNADSLQRIYLLIAILGLYFNVFILVSDRSETISLERDHSHAAIFGPLAADHLSAVCVRGLYGSHPIASRSRPAQFQLNKDIPFSRGLS